MASPIPKPAGRRQRRNTRSLGVVPEAGQIEAPAPPAGLLKAQREAWAAYWASPVAAMVDAGSDLPALRRLFELRDERDRTWKAYREQRMVAGSQGQPVLNPLAKMTGDLDKEIRQLEDRFGLTPQARLRLGASFGEASRALSEMNRALAGGDDEPGETWVDLEANDGAG